MLRSAPPFAIITASITGEAVVGNHVVKDGGQVVVHPISIRRHNYRCGRTGNIPGRNIHADVALEGPANAWIEFALG